MCNLRPLEYSSTKEYVGDIVIRMVKHIEPITVFRFFLLISISLTYVHM